MKVKTATGCFHRQMFHLANTEEVTQVKRKLSVVIELTSQIAETQNIQILQAFQLLCLLIKVLIISVFKATNV